MSSSIVVIGFAHFLDASRVEDQSLSLMDDKDQTLGRQTSRALSVFYNRKKDNT